MRSLLITATVVTAAMALAGCPGHHPVPGRQSSADGALTLGTAAHTQVGSPSHSASAPAEIIWFQGTLDEAFARRPCPCDEPQRRK